MTKCAAPITATDKKVPKSPDEDTVIRMARDPREALEEFIDALREHMEIALEVQDPDSDEVLDAADVVGDAFDEYDEALFDVSGVDTPLDYLDDSYDDEDDDLDDEDEDED